MSCVVHVRCVVGAGGVGRRISFNRFSIYINPNTPGKCIISITELSMKHREPAIIPLRHTGQSNLFLFHNEETIAPFHIILPFFVSYSSIQ